MHTDPQRQRAAAAGYRVRNQKLKIDLKGTHNLRGGQNYPIARVTSLNYAP